MTPPAQDRYHHGNLRSALLAQARARLAAGDEAELSLRELATRVGVSVNATYRHFQSKEALLMELAAEGFDELRQAMEHALPLPSAGAGAGAGESLHAAGEAYVAFAARERGLYRLMFSHKGRFEAHEGFRDASAAAFTVLLRLAAAARGDVPESASTMKAAMAAWALAHGVATLAAEGYLQALPDALRPEPGAILAMLDPRV
jgi:AcrR family transcriptional regulator